MDYYDLGGYSRTVTTTSPEAQTWFDRGLVWTYGYNHEEAIACFERALAAEPRLRHGALGHRLCHRAQLQQAVGSLRGGGKSPTA